MIILFPSDYFSRGEADSAYAPEYEAASKIPEFKILLFNYDEFIETGVVKIFPRNPPEGGCIYRG